MSRRPCLVLGLMLVVALAAVWLAPADAAPPSVVRAAGGARRVRAYVASGVVYAVGEEYRGAAGWTTARGPVQLSKTAGTAALGVTASGTGFSYPTGYATLGDQISEGDGWFLTLDGTTEIGTWSPGAASSARFTIATAGDPGANYIRIAAYVGRSDLTSGVRVALGRHTGTLVVGGQGNDLAEGSGVACTWDAPAEGLLVWRGGSNTAEVGQGWCRRSGTLVATTGTAPSAALGSSLVFALIATRPALGGGTGAMTSVEAILYPAAGELTW